MINPWAIYIGIFAAALPVAIHFLTRPRPVRYSLSTLRFVREAVRQKRARHRLRDWTILALRTAAVFLLAVAIARPLLGDKSLNPAADAGSATRVVILDISQSMAAVDKGVQAMERARPIAANYLDYRPGLQANLVLAAARPRAVFERPSANFGALRDELARCSVVSQRLNVKAALEAAAQMLAETSTGGRRELVVISDFQRSNWAAADFGVCPADTQVQLESIAPLETPANLAIVRVGSRGRSSVGKEVQLEVEVANFSQATQRVRVDVALGEASCQLEGVCPAGSRTTLAHAIVPRNLGWQIGEARLIGVEDALPADDVRPAVLEVRPAPTYAFITRQSASQRPSSSYYLERALGSATGSAGARIVRVDPGQLDRDVLSAADLILLDHPGKLPRDSERLLAALLRRGRPILYVTAEIVDATNLKLLTQAAGTELQLPVEFMPPLAGQPRRDLFLTDVKGDEAPFRIFGDNVTNVVSSLRFSGGLSSRQLENTLADDVLARYSDRSAFLVHTQSGAGSLAVLNADLGSSNLPRSEAFVPLLSELVERLLAHQQSQSSFPSGEPLAAFLPAESGAAAGLKIVGQSAEGELTDEGVSVMWRAPAAGPPGIYQVHRDDKRVFALASTIPEEEGDLRPLAPDVLQDRLSGGRTVAYRSAAAGDRGRDDLWTWLAVACVVCLALELTALRAFRT